MKISGIIESISSDGYDRLIDIKTASQTVWCSGLQCNEYIDEGGYSKHLAVNDRVSLTASLKLISKFEIVSGTAFPGVVQPKNSSPHTIVTGHLIEKNGTDEYLLSIGDGEVIILEFEMPVDLTIADYIQVQGELVVELEQYRE